MLISVIIPLYNRAALIGRTLDNVLSQSLKEIEVIVVDDGSTDDSATVVESYGERVRLIKQDNRGPGAARNAGLQVAKGAFIQFFDSDDLMTKNKLEVQAKILLDTGADFAYSSYVKAAERNGEWEQLGPIMQYYPLDEKKKLTHLVLSGWCPITQSVLFRRDLIEKVGRWNEELMPHEDLEYWFRIAQVARKRCHTNKAAVIYRQHGVQITNGSVGDKERWEDGIRAMGYIEDMLENDSSFVAMCFRGRAALSKIKYHEKFGHSFMGEVRLKEKFYAVLWQLKSKAERVYTGSDWGKVQGALMGKDEIFRSYISNI